MHLAGAVARAVRRRLNWDTVAVALSLAIMAAACVALFHLVREVDREKIVSALAATPARTVAIAAVLIAASYAALTLYDFFALRTIGRAHVPYRVAAFTGFVAYTIGHNLGATVFTGGAVRFRIYRAWGLTLTDVAKIAFITGLTFWLGNVFVLGLGVAIAPSAASAINQLPPWLNRLLAGAALLAIVAYLLWLLPRPRSLGRNGWRITLPNAPLTLVQIAIGVTDLALGALAMYVLVAAHGAVDVVALVVTFVVATLLGFASHAPGSLGVFDAAMLFPLAGIARADLIAALIIFRCLYFAIPFCVAVSMLGIRELWLAAKG